MSRVNSEVKGTPPSCWSAWAPSKYSITMQGGINTSQLTMHSPINIYYTQGVSYNWCLLKSKADLVAQRPLLLSKHSEKARKYSRPATLSTATGTAILRLGLYLVTITDTTNALMIYSTEYALTAYRTGQIHMQCRTWKNYQFGEGSCSKLFEHAWAVQVVDAWVGMCPPYHTLETSNHAINLTNRKELLCDEPIRPA